MISRLETMVLMGMDLPLQAIRAQIASGIDIFVHLSRLRDKSRKVVEISEVQGIKDGEIILNTLFQFQEEEEEDRKIKGIWKKTGKLIHNEKRKTAGLQ